MTILDSLKERASLWKSRLGMVFARLIYPTIRVQPVDLQGKRALITGANSGIGKETARVLAQQGAEVWLLCRNPTSAEEARAELAGDTGNERIFIEIVDMSSLRSVGEFDRRWALRSSEERKVDMLFNNAGLVNSTRRTTSEGFELTFVTNFLSAFLSRCLQQRPSPPGRPQLIGPPQQVR